MKLKSRKTSYITALLLLLVLAFNAVGCNFAAGSNVSGSDDDAPDSGESVTDSSCDCELERISNLNESTARYKCKKCGEIFLTTDPDSLPKSYTFSGPIKVSSLPDGDTVGESLNEEVLNILNRGLWEREIIATDYDFAILINERELFYDSDDGVLDYFYENRHCVLNATEKRAIDDFFASFLSENHSKDFSFSLTWNTYGISSYDSESGRLVKSTDSPEPEKFVTTLYLTDEELQTVCDLIEDLDVHSYPDEYNPNENVMSEPSMTLILTVRMWDWEKTVRAEDIAAFYESEDEKGHAFLSICYAISSLIEETEEWGALPEYDVFYD